MKYASIGTIPSEPEVTDISPFGLWILYRGKEYFLDYVEFPWFLKAPVQKVFKVVEDGIEHLRWPELDIDLTLESVKTPGEFPLVYEPSASYSSGEDAGK